MPIKEDHLITSSKNQPLWNRHMPIVVGTVLALAVLLVDGFVSRPSKDSIVLSLMPLLAGFIIDVLYQLHKLEHRFVEMLDIEQSLLKDTWLGGVIRSQIKYYVAIVDSPDRQEIAIDEAQKKLKGTVARLREVATGRFTFPAREEMRVNRDILKSARDEFLATSYVGLDSWWDKPEAEDYLEEHKDLAKRQGAQRIFIFSGEAEGVVARKEGYRQKQLGIDCYVVDSDTLKDTHLTDFIIADDRTVSITHQTKAGATKFIEVSIVKSTVREYRKYFNDILANGKRNPIQKPIE